jgi:hypothetical protein
MRTRLLVATLALVIPTGLVAQRNPEQVAINSTYAAAPATIQELWQAVPLVAVVQITSREQASVPGRDRARPIVLHTAHVIEVLKDTTGTPGKKVSITVAQIGGSMVSSGTNVFVDDRSFPVLSEGKRYVLFLKYWPAAKAFTPEFGPGGTYPVSDASVVTLPSPSMFSGAKTKPLADLLTELRALKSPAPTFRN